MLGYAPMPLDGFPFPTVDAGGPGGTEGGGQTVCVDEDASVQFSFDFDFQSLLTIYPNWWDGSRDSFFPPLRFDSTIVVLSVDYWPGNLNELMWLCLIPTAAKSMRRGRVCPSLFPAWGESRRHITKHRVAE